MGGCSRFREKAVSSIDEHLERAKFTVVVLRAKMGFARCGQRFRAAFTVYGRLTAVHADLIEHEHPDNEAVANFKNKKPREGGFCRQ